MVLGKYREKEIILPVIRLGNAQYVTEALRTIKKLYAFEMKDTPKEELLSKLKEKSKENNKRLVDRLNNYENRIDLSQNLEFVNGLLSKGSNHLLEREKQKLEQRLNEIPEIVTDDLNNIYDVIKGNHQLLQFFYFESLRCVKRLRTRDYQELIEILELDDEVNQITD